MISIVSCCHGAKLCAHTAWDFRSKKYEIEQNLKVLLPNNPLTFVSMYSLAL